jgi:hypothetical protein
MQIKHLTENRALQFAAGIGCAGPAEFVTPSFRNMSTSRGAAASLLTGFRRMVCLLFWGSKLSVLLVLLLALAHGQTPGAAPQSNYPTAVGYPITGVCGGTVGAANTTAYLFFPTQLSTSTCSATATGTPGGSAAANNEIPVTAPMTASRLTGHVGTACTAAGTAITLYKNGSPTTLTVTGLTATNTNVSDITHQVTFAVGDTYSLRIVTAQATETCANARATFAASPM